jgi:hypothetical protein
MVAVLASIAAKFFWSSMGSEHAEALSAINTTDRLATEPDITLS